MESQDDETMPLEGEGSRIIWGVMNNDHGYDIENAKNSSYTYTVIRLRAPGGLLLY